MSNGAASVQYAICLNDYAIVEGNDRLELKRGQEYIVTKAQRDGNVRVFSNYWAWVPATLFAGPRPL